MKKIIASIAATSIMFFGAITSSPTAEAVSVTRSCTYSRGGSTWNVFTGEWVKVRCTDARIKRYRIYAICDRLGNQSDRVARGPWVNLREWSTVACNAVGDWEIRGYGVNYET